MGGFNTRHWGRPSDNIHAIQLEISQDVYMDELSFEFDSAKGEKLSQRLYDAFQKIVKIMGDL